MYEQVASLVYLIVSHTHGSTAWNGWNLRALMVRSPKEFATAYASATLSTESSRASCGCEAHCSTVTAAHA